MVHGFCRLSSHSTSLQWWACGSLRKKHRWTVQHSTFGCSSVIHPKFCRPCSHSTSSQWRECGSLRRQPERTMQHSTFRCRSVNPLGGTIILIALKTVCFTELIGMVFGSLRLLGRRRVLWQQGVLFLLLRCTVPKILMLLTLVFGLVVMTLAVLTILLGLVLVVHATWISRPSRVSFLWLGLSGSFLVWMLTWIVFMLGLFLCSEPFGNFGMALNVLCWSLHDLLLMSFAMAWVSPLLFWGWLLAGLLVFVQGFLALWIGWRRCSLSARPRALLIWG